MYGRVVDQETGQGISGVIVMLDDNTAGAQTAADGSFTIIVDALETQKSKTTLRFSSADYESAERPVRLAPGKAHVPVMKLKSRYTGMILGGIGLLQSVSRPTAYQLFRIKLEVLRQTFLT
ncbi:carboxypeptidase-like regulatory domain-containing protein [Hymenobacter sp. J193]|uniref:carboxypeptidase-like regulatory domain-containing protein n=1 Tax=Hymenobacter sp. J193 TaxID=2898429 RepID=UPI0035B00E85